MGALGYFAWNLSLRPWGMGPLNHVNQEGSTRARALATVTHRGKALVSFENIAIRKLL